MRIARAAGFAEPKVIRYGEDPEDRRAPVSIPMTGLPGELVGDVYEYLTDEEKHQVLSEMKMYLDRMRN